jgi:hypothetical protein
MVYTDVSKEAIVAKSKAIAKPAPTARATTVKVDRQGIETLIGMVQTMVEQSGDPTDFDAARWVGGWLVKPLPALAGATPASYMGTFEGQKLVAELLSMSQSGAYA